VPLVSRQVTRWWTSPAAGAAPGCGSRGRPAVGIDFSAEAIAQASERRTLFGLESSATFAVGTLEDTGLATGIADAVVCVDAIQFATDGVAAAQEIRRILRRGGRVVLTSWEARDRSDESMPERIRKVDLAGWLEAAGFTTIVIHDQADWHEVSRRLWETAMSLDVGDDPALASTRAEAERSLANHDGFLRRMATAVAP
jgi:SAM-dependent methyltransferase